MWEIIKQIYQDFKRVWEESGPLGKVMLCFGAALALIAAGLIFSLGHTEDICKLTGVGCKPKVVEQPSKSPSAGQDTGGVPTPVPPPEVKKKVLLVESGSHQDALEFMESALRSDFQLSPRPVFGKWLARVDEFSDEKPDVIVVHLHSLRQGAPDGELDRQAATELLRGLLILVTKDPKRRVLVYSSSFLKRDAKDIYCDLQYAAVRAAKQENRSIDLYQVVLERTVLYPWSGAKSSGEEVNFRAAVAKAVERPPSMDNYPRRKVCDRRLASAG